MTHQFAKPRLAALIASRLHGENPHVAARCPGARPDSQPGSPDGSDTSRKARPVKRLLATGLAYAGVVLIGAFVSSSAMAAGWTSSASASEVARLPVGTIAPWEWPAASGFFSSPDRPLPGAPVGSAIVLGPELMNTVDRILQGAQPKTKTARLAWYTFVHEYTHSRGWDHPVEKLPTAFYNRIRKQYPVIAQRAHLEPPYASWLERQVFGPVGLPSNS